jgi:ABC-type antimicrobial peptide transport system permease subunit
MIEKLRFYTRHSFNDLRVNGQRTIFALLCIAAGVAAIVSLQTLGVMIKDTLTGSIQESNRGDMRISVISRGGAGGPSTNNDQLIQQGVNDGVIAEGGTLAMDYISANGIEKIRAWFTQNYPGSDITYRQAINSFASAQSISLPAKNTDKTPVSAFIIEASKYPFYGKRTVNSGKTLSEVLQAPTDIVLSQNLADDLGAHVGDTVRLSGASQDFIVRGIMPTSEESGYENILGALFGYYFIDVSAVPLFADLKPGAELIYVKLSDPAQVETVNKAFEKQFPYLDTTTTVDLENQNSDISKYVGEMVTVMGLVSLLIGGIGIVNTMLVIVSRRTTEIAVLKTIGLEGEQVTVLFLVEAVLMGFFGSLLGIVFGWLAAYGIKGVAEGFLAQTLTFRITLQPPLTGLLVGIITTAIFGFIPTLAAGQVRPNLVLRPSETMVPHAGRARAFAALLFVMLAISLIAQPLIHDLLNSSSLKSYAQMIGAVLGFLMGAVMLAGGVFANRTGGQLVLRIVRWLVLLPGLPALGFLFGYYVPALLILFSTFIAVGLLYVLLWVLIWTIGGGSLADVWLLKRKPIRTFRRQLARSEGWKRNILVRRLIDLGLIVVTVPVWVLNGVLIVVMLPFWLLGRAIQWVAFVDFRLALRSMLVTKGRNASTLLALVVGVFTLSLITMLATAITKRFEQVIVNEVGGNVIVFAAGGQNTLQNVQTRLDSIPGVTSYSLLSTFQTKLVSATFTDTEQTVTLDQLKTRAQATLKKEKKTQYSVNSLDSQLGGVDAREVTSNLPNVKFYAGRQLNASDTGPWDASKGEYPPIVIGADEVVIASGLQVGDLLTFDISGSSGPGVSTPAQPQVMTFKIVGMIDRTGNNIAVNFGSQNYAPKSAFDALGLSPDMVSAVVDIQSSQISALRLSMNQIPGVFVLETKVLNDLIDQIIHQFTSFPILVATLSLVVGGIVIANSVALSTLERRREIAIMKAVGLQRERVLGMLLFEYGLMGLIGGLIGVGLGGLILLMLLTQLFNGELGNTIPYLTALQLMSLCVLIALVAAVLTAWRASGEKPLNVLRYE